jgi:type I restriction enzyme S subunit
MPIPEHLQPILAELKRGLEAIYGDRLKAVVLFGSQARGEATPDSDVDVAVVLDAVEDSYQEIDRVGDLFWELTYKHGVHVTSVPVAERQWRERSSRFYRNLRREGVAV